MVGLEARIGHRIGSGYTSDMMTGLLQHGVLRCSRPLVLLISAAIELLAAGCGSPLTVDDPMAALANVDNGPRVHMAAMAALDAQPQDEAYLAALHRVVWKRGYTVDAREAAVQRLIQYDPEGLQRTLRQQLPRMTAWAGLTRLCEIIAEQGWTDLSPALVSSWARPTTYVQEETDRPEYKALAGLFGAETVPDVVFDMLITSNKVSQQGLRTRCWDLLHRLGRREQLVRMLTERQIPADDAFMLDLKAGAEELGLVPHNREEILWLRKLRQPERRAFWDEAVAALTELSPSRRASLEFRDIPIVVSAARHEPDLLGMDESDLYARLGTSLRGRKHYSRGSNWDNQSANQRERLYEWRDELTWGDLAAMCIAIRALQVPQVVDHLFDYAERDRRDETTEYGGVIALDEKGRFEILEFPPRIREHDQKFIASQAMLDAAYTSLFHFHLHAQRHWNRDYAGPGFGDVNYADNTRANCLVFTFISEEAMNVDFYRHGRVIVDLGEIRR
jgi:hypothetical protein